ncbi:MAG: IclR family transcriptional regulator, partial [Anaeroplasmataceae bacterium]|nr:IclR family transcriptional regulator [Anaeroplasmataceae bacterium]
DASKRQANNDAVTFKQITDNVKMPKSSAFDIVHSLLELNFIETNQYNDKKYELGIKAFALGQKYSQKKTFIEICSNHLMPLADELERTAFVGVRSGADVIYVYKYMGTGAKLATCNVGSSHPTYATALGKSLLAYLEPEVQKEILDSINFVEKTSNTIMDKNVLEANLKDTKKRGYSIDNKENEQMMICYGAPIFDASNKLIAAISFSDVKNPVLSDEEIGRKIRECALRISRELGYSGKVFWEE